MPVVQGGCAAYDVDLDERCNTALGIRMHVNGQDTDVAVLYLPFIREETLNAQVREYAKALHECYSKELKHIIQLKKVGVAEINPQRPRFLRYKRQLK